jgi:hypothetical protein
MDAGKAEHHCVLLGADGTRELLQRVVNDENALLKLISDVLELSVGEPVTWAIDLNAGGAALMIALLTDHGQKVLYIPGRTVHHASGSYRGDGKTDAKDAFVIADQARMRCDLQPVHRGDDIAVDAVSHLASPAPGCGLLLDLVDRAEVRDAAAAWTGRVNSVIARTDRVDVDALLIRPDGCVAWALPTGQDLDATTLVRALGTWFGQPA